MFPRTVLALIWLATGMSLFGGDNDIVSQVQRLLNPQSRFILNEPKPDGSYGHPKLNGQYAARDGARSFLIRGIVDEHDLLIEVDRDGRAQARFERIGRENLGPPMDVSLNDGRFDQTDQSLDGRLKANDGIPRTIVFGVYWDVSSTGTGPDSVEYNLAFRTDPAAPIKVVRCPHDLRGTPLEAPRRAAADVAAGGLLAGADTLFLTVFSLGASTPDERSRLLPRLQPVIDSTILRMDQLTRYTGSSSLLVARRARSALAPTKRLAAALQQLRDPKLASSYLQPSDQTRVDAVLTSWATGGVPFTSPDKSP
jgi:hypothetical protein